ncbi:MAG: hypothetical protein U0736_14325 [Gemmataceae bacterium]
MAWDGWRRLFRRSDDVGRARGQFVAERDRLLAEFFRAAAGSGKPRGLRWTACDPEPGQRFARDRQSGELIALVGVTVAFEAIAGGDMEGVAAVGNLRNATAVFFHRRGAWATHGKAVFNLNPDEVLERFATQYEAVDPA